MVTRFSRPAETAALSALILGVVLVAAPVAASAAPVGGRQAEATRTASVAPEDATGSVAAKPADEEPGCQKSRRKLWVEGEGWIVRRVTTCH